MVAEEVRQHLSVEREKGATDELQALRAGQLDVTGNLRERLATLKSKVENVEKNLEQHYATKADMGRARDEAVKTVDGKLEQHYATKADVANAKWRILLALVSVVVGTATVTVAILRAVGATNWPPLPPW